MSIKSLINYAAIGQLISPCNPATYQMHHQLSFRRRKHQLVPQKSIEEPKGLSDRMLVSDCRDHGKWLDQRVSLSGWISASRILNQQSLVFERLRDHTGSIQLLLSKHHLRNFAEIAAKIANSRHELLESVVSISGILRLRPLKNRLVQGTRSSQKNVPKQIQNKQTCRQDHQKENGHRQCNLDDVEVVVDQWELVNEASLTDAVAMTLNQRHDPSISRDSSLRWMHLRTEEMQKNLSLRHRICSIAHEYFDEHNFVHVETPMIFRSTPEGAREFRVLSSSLSLPDDSTGSDNVKKSGDIGSASTLADKAARNPQQQENLALTQSPQQFKQMLMAGGIHKYYQLARCFRDEDLRSDRQFEFTQIDMEISFCENQQNVMSCMEGLVRRVWKRALHLDIENPIKQMSYQEAMSRFGSDKPDLRYSFEIEEDALVVDPVVIEACISMDSLICKAT